MDTDCNNDLIFCTNFATEMLYDKRAKELPNFWSLKELAFYEMLFLPHETLYGKIHTKSMQRQIQIRAPT